MTFYTTWKSILRVLSTLDTKLYTPSWYLKSCMQCSVINVFWPLQTIFDSYVLSMVAIYYFRWPYTTYGFTLLSAAIYYFWRLYITFDGYILLLALPDCDFVRIQDFITISCTYGLKARLDFNINLLGLIQFCFFSSSMVSSINFNAPF